MIIHLVYSLKGVVLKKLTAIVKGKGVKRVILKTKRIEMKVGMDRMMMSMMNVKRMMRVVL